jgi:hypothetical protein
MKMETLKQRLQNGERVELRCFEHGDYVIHLTKGPPILFDNKVTERADKVIEEFTQLS